MLSRCTFPTQKMGLMNETEKGEEQLRPFMLDNCCPRVELSALNFGKIT